VPAARIPESIADRYRGPGFIPPLAYGL